MSTQEETTSARLWRATTETMHIVVAGSAAVGAAALGSWPILALGGATYAALVAWNFFSPEPRNKALEFLFPEPESLQDPAGRDAAKAFIKARVALKKVLKESPENITQHLSSVSANKIELERRAAALLARAEQLWSYLATVNEAHLDSELRSLSQRLNNSRDSGAREEFGKAYEAKKEQKRAVSDIQDARERIYGQLARIQATLEGLPPKIVRLRVLDEQAMDSLTGEVSQQLEDMSAEVGAFEETLKHLAEVTV